MSRESAPSATNFDSPLITESSVNARCFLTMVHTDRDQHSAIEHTAKELASKETIKKQLES